MATKSFNPYGVYKRFSDQELLKYVERKYSMIDSQTFCLSNNKTSEKNQTCTASLSCWEKY